MADKIRLGKVEGYEHAVFWRIRSIRMAGCDELSRTAGLADDFTFYTRNNFGWY
jgi:hypothetical protein